MKIPPQRLKGKTGGSLTDPLSCLAVFAIVTGTVVLVRWLRLPFGSVLIPALWGFGAILPLRAGEGDLLAFGLHGPGLWKNLRYFLLSSFVVFPLFAAGVLVYARLGFPPPTSPIPAGVSFSNWFFNNYLAIALFEELFFRGFVQGRFEKFAGAGFSHSGAVFWVPILVSSLLFALAHVAADLDPARIVVFFPGLLFGWLRVKTGTLLAPILSHGTANLVSMLLTGWIS